MSERRPHWDDDLIEAVQDCVLPRRLMYPQADDVYAIIAAVEDWQAQRLGACVPQLAAWQYEKQTIPLWHWAQAEAAIQRVRGRAEGPTPAVHGDWMAGYASAMRDILRALDGPVTPETP